MLQCGSGSVGVFARGHDEQLIADLEVVEVPDGPHNIGWTYPDEVNAALLDFLAR